MLSMARASNNQRLHPDIPRQTDTMHEALL